MQRRDFSYELPSDLIAQYPVADRTNSRLLMLDGNSGRLSDRLFTELPQLLNPNDLLVFNDTRVIPARLFGQKDSGGKVEVLIERITGESTALAHIRASKSPKPGATLRLESAVTATVTDRRDDLFVLDFSANDCPLLTLLETHGHMPLPPYIERNDAGADRERYQTVYARHPGAVAAPTAGLHFDQPLLDALTKKGIRQAFVTLHVGAGTFQPMRVDDVTQHRMHAEYLDVSDSVCTSIRRAKEEGGRVIAVGTTAVRALETASKSGATKPYRGETDIFIYPGYRFNVIDAMVTNFHLPESTLIMLVSAFAGYDHVMAAYRHAVEQRYRFFSYGDAMFITRRTN